MCASLQLRGVELCTAAELADWAFLGYTVHPYQMRKIDLVFRQDEQFTLGDARARERLMCFEVDHTMPALRSSMAKADPWLKRITRCSLLGNSMDRLSLAPLVAALAVECKSLSRLPTVEEIRSGAAADLRVTKEPLIRHSARRRRQLEDDENLIWWFMGQSDHCGSDVRFTSRKLMKPSRGIRTSIDHRLWKWEAKPQFEWMNKNDLHSYRVSVAVVAYIWHELKRKLAREMHALHGNGEGHRP